MKSLNKDFKDISIRYLILVLVALPNFWLFYLIFTPLTLYPVYFLLSIFFETSLIQNTIFIGKIPIELIPACIAGVAYYLLFVLNLSVPAIKIKQRIKMISFSFALLLFLNILRISLLSFIFLSDASIFDVAHKVFWYTGSTIFVVGIWFIEVKIFKIKQTPFYSDIKFLFNKSLLKKKIKKSKRS